VIKADASACQNGQGKSTLVKLLLGQIKPSSGTIERHPLMRIGYFSQDAVSNLSKVSARDPKLTALKYFSEEAAHENTVPEEGEIRACLGSLGLQGKVASDTPVALLSGGQKVCRP
jgi:ATP-binding cassette subfamily F protein 3